MRRSGRCSSRSRAVVLVAGAGLAEAAFTTHESNPQTFTAGDRPASRPTWSPSPDQRRRSVRQPDPVRPAADERRQRARIDLDDRDDAVLVHRGRQHRPAR